MKKNFLLPAIIIPALFLSCASYAQTSVAAGDMIITSKLMTLFKNIYVARGGLKAEQRDSTMTADRGIYDRDLEIVKAIDNVVVTQPGSTLTADYLEAYVKEDRLVARGNPKLTRVVERISGGQSADGEETEAKVKKTRVILTCDEVEAFNKENRFVAKGAVRVIEVAYREGETDEEAEENEKQPITDLVCEWLEMFSKEDKAIAHNDVEIKTDTLRATGDKAIYLQVENKMTIVGKAHAFQTTKDAKNKSEQVSELYANKILYFPDEERTIAVGNVQATVYPSSSPHKDKKDKDKKKKKKGKKDKKDKKNKADTELNDEIEVPKGEYIKIGAKNEAKNSNDE